jgi:hypothetical protein
MPVEDLFLLDDLKSLRIPWVDRLVGGCMNHEDVERAWVLLRCWGPDREDGETLSPASAPPSPFRRDAEKLRSMVRSIESWRP